MLPWETTIDGVVRCILRFKCMWHDIFVRAPALIVSDPEIIGFIVIIIAFVEGNIYRYT